MSVAKIWNPNTLQWEPVIVGKQGPAGPQGPAGAPQTPASTVEDETTFGLTPAVGTSADYARADHTHGSQPREVPDPATLAADDLLTVAGGAYAATTTPKVDKIRFDTGSQSLNASGELAWDDLDQALAYRTGTLTIDIAQENVVYVRNPPAAPAIPAGAVVAVLGAEANRLSVQLCDTTAGQNLGCRTLGVAMTAIGSPGFGFVSTFGLLRGFNTTNIVGSVPVAPGVEVFGSSTPGVLSTDPQPSPGRRVTVGYVVTTGVQGSIFVTVRRGLSVNELDNVFAPSPSDGQVLAYNLANARYELTTLTAASVGAYPDTNPSGFVDAAGAAAAAPVQSVNTQTGAVVLNAASVGAVPTSRNVNTSGTGLSGGGDLSADRTITIDPSALAGDTAFTSAFVAAGQGLPVGGTTGQVLAKTSGTDYASGWGDPSLVGGAARPLLSAGAHLDGTGLVLSGIANNWASTPDSAALDVTGDIDIRIRMRPGVAWNVASAISISKSVAYQLLHGFNTINGQVILSWRQSGVTFNSASTVAASANLGTAPSDAWIRGTLDVDNGAGGRTIEFFTSLDGVAWTQLGATVTEAGVASIDNSASEVRIGENTGFGGLLGIGTVYRAQVLNGINNTVVFDADFSTQTANALAFTESSTNAATVTINTTRYTYGIPGAGFTTVSTQAVAANTDYFEPFQLNNSAVVDLLAWEVTTAPSSTATVHGAIYRATDDLQPTGAPVATFGGVSVATSTTGVYTTQITPVTLTPGPYVLAFNSSVAFTARSARQQAALIHTLGANPVLLTTTAPRTNAAFPNPSTGWNARAASSVGRNTFAVIRWRPA